MGWIFGTPKKEEKKKEKKTIFDSYSSAEDYAEDHIEDHDGWEEAIDAWELHQDKKRARR